MKEPICPLCKRRRPKGWTAELSRRRSAHIKTALANSDMQIGRPRSVDYELIWKLRDSGHSLSQISANLKIGRGSVQHALRRREEKPKQPGGEE